MPEASLSCGPNGWLAVPSPQYEVVFGRVALPTKLALGAVALPNEPDPNARFWAKQGLEIKANASFDLVVPRQWRGRLSFGWRTVRTTHLKVPRCPSSVPGRRWLWFVGGYYVRDPACVSVLVKVGSKTRRVHIGIGASCPGQTPPRQPRLPEAAS